MEEVRNVWTPADEGGNYLDGCGRENRDVPEIGEGDGKEEAG